MKSQKKAAWFISGVLCSALLFSSVIPAVAAMVEQKLTVHTGVQVFVDDMRLDAGDTHGNPDAFIYNGTTYVAVAAVSKSLGQNVLWDGNTKSVYIGKHNSTKPAAWLSTMDYFNKSGMWYFDATTTDNLGVEHDHSLCMSSVDYYGSLTYNLNGRYSRLTGLFYQEYYDRAVGKDSTLSIYADGEKVWSAKVGPGILPVDISVDLTGVLQLELKVDGDARYTALGEMALWA